MDEKLIQLKAIISLVGGSIVGFLGGWDIALKVLVIFVVLDYFTGVAAAWVDRSLNSDVGFRGIAKKVMMFVPVAVCYWLDTVLGEQLLRSMAIFFYIANEGLSILENLARVGVPVPASLRNVLVKLKEKDENGGGS